MRVLRDRTAGHPERKEVRRGTGRRGKRLVPLESSRELYPVGGLAPARLVWRAGLV